MFLRGVKQVWTVVWHQYPCFLLKQSDSITAASQTPFYIHITLTLLAQFVTAAACNSTFSLTLKQHNATSYNKLPTFYPYAK